MADKFPQTLVVEAKFVSGEAPKATKLSVISAQTKAALRRVEKAIGDVQDQNAPYSADAPVTSLSRPAGKLADADVVDDSPAQRRLDIASIARLIGPASNLNPHELDDGTGAVEEVVPTSGVTAVHEFFTSYLPDGALTFSDSTVFATLVATPNLLNAAGEYYVDTDTGRVFSYTAMNGGTVTYDVRPAEWAGGTSPQRASFNVIPDPAQLENGVGLTDGGLDVDNRYIFTLPTCTHQQWNAAGDGTTLGQGDVNGGQQLKLPYVLTEMFDSLPGGPFIIPEGFVVLKNYTNGAVYSQAVAWWVSETEIRFSGIYIDTELANGDLFYLITVGSDITGAIDDLRRKSRHAGRRDLGQALVDVENIAGILRYEAPSGGYGPSSDPSNWAPQYLHRDGYLGGDDGAADNNVMRGDLVLGKGSTPGAFYGTGATTKKLAFGTQDQVFFRYNQTMDKLELNGKELHADDGITVQDRLFIDALIPYPQVSEDNPGAGSGFVSIKRVNVSSLTFAEKGDDHIWNSYAGVGLFWSLTPSPSASGPSVGYAFLDLASVVNGSALSTLGGADSPRITQIWIDVVSLGPNISGSDITVTVLKVDSGGVFTTIATGLIRRADDGLVSLLALDESDAFEIRSNEYAVIRFMFRATATDSAPLVRGIQIQTRSKYLAGN
jgi:hypothetical protein